MFEIKTQGNNERKPMATLGNLKLACVELGISDDKHTLRRASRAFDLYHSGKVEHLNDHTFRVKSQYNERLPYQVHISKSGTSYCTCPDWRNYSGDLVLPDVHFHCKHSIAARIWLHHNGNGNGSKVVNECGTSEAKSVQDKLNGSNGTGDNQSPVRTLDTSDPFQESEQLDIDQIEGRSNGDLVHVLSNGEYVISYNGIMALAEQHGVTFLRHTVKSDAKRNGTVIAYAQCRNNTRASGKTMNGSFITAVELAKRNAARQLLPLVEIKAFEKKAQLESEFDWEVAKAKCLELVPQANLNCIINDLVNDGKLEQKHPSDYGRKEWLVIFDAVNNDGGGKPLPSDKFVECRDVAKHDIRYSWLKADMLKEGEVTDEWTDDDIAKLKSACEIDASLFGKELGHWTVDIQPNTNAPYVYQRRYWFWLMPMSRRCFWCGKSRKESILPDTCIHWKRYEVKASLCLECSQKVGKGELDKDRIVQKFDELYHADPSEQKAARKAFRRKPSASHRAEVPDNVDDFIAKCKQAEAEAEAEAEVEVEVEVEDTIEDVDDTPTNGDGKRKLQMGKDKVIWLIEANGTKKQMGYREAEKMKRNSTLHLTQGIACGADISTVELDD